MRTTANRRRAAIRITAWGAILAVALTGCRAAGDSLPVTEEIALTGIITGGDGSPVVGAQVEIIGRDGTLGARVETDGDGRYASDVADGTYDIIVVDTDSIDEPSDTTTDTQAAGGASITTASVSDDIDHGENVLLGEIVVDSESSGNATVQNIELPESQASDFSDPDKTGGRVTLAFTEGTPGSAEERPVGPERVELVRIVPMTATSRGEDAAAVPEPRTITLDENGTAVTDLETDQIIGMDIQLLDASGNVFELIPMTKPEGDLTVTINLDSSDVHHAQSSTGIPAEHAIAAANDSDEASLPSSDASTTDALESASDSIQEEVTAGADLPASITPLGYATRKPDTTNYGFRYLWTFQDDKRPLRVGETSFLNQAYVQVSNGGWMSARDFGAAYILSDSVSLLEAKSYWFYKYTVRIHTGYSSPTDYRFTDATGDTYALRTVFSKYAEDHEVNFNSSNATIVKYSVWSL